METTETERPAEAREEGERSRAGGLLRRPGRRTVVVLAAVLVGLELVYLLAANLFLSSDLASRVINRRPEKLLVSWQSAWSPWPGEVRVTGLALRGQGRRQQWTATADRISGHVGLVPLLWKSFRATDVEGERVIFRLRRREDRPQPKKEAEGEPTELPPEAEAAEPPIPGLENPPEPAPEEVYPPLDPDRRHWTVVLAGFDLDEVSEVWIDRVRIRGDLSLADGGMTMKLKESIEVHPSRFRLEGARVDFDDERVADAIDGELLLSSQAFDHTEHRGLDAIPFLLAKADLEARLASLDWLNPYLGSPSGGGPKLEGGTGMLDVDATLREARFAPGSRLTLGAPELGVRFLDYSARGDGELVWSVDEADARLVATLASYHLRRDGYDAPHVVGKGLTMTLSELGDALPPSFDEAKIEIEMPPAHVPELTFYNAYLPPAAGLAIRDGSATVRASFEAKPSEGTGSGHVALVSDRMRADFRGTPLVGALDLEGSFPSVDLAARRFALDGTKVTIRDARLLGEEGDEAKPWAGQVTVKDGTLAPGTSILLRARAVGAITDVRPVLSLFAAGDNLPGWVLDALGIDDVQARAAIEVGGDRVTLSELVARADDLTLDGTMRLSGDRGGKDGRLLIGYKGLHVGLDLKGGETDLKLLHAQRWYEEGK